MRRIDSYLPLDDYVMSEVELRYKAGDTLGMGVVMMWTFRGRDGEERTMRVVMSNN